MATGIGHIDDEMIDLVCRISEQSLASRPELAPKIIAISKMCNSKWAMKLWRILEDNGHKNFLVDIVPRTTKITIDDIPRQLAQTTIAFLDLIESLGTPKKLTFGQSRRLDEIADLIETLDIASSEPSCLSHGVHHDRDNFKFLLEAIVELGSVDRGVVVSQARILKELQMSTDRYLGLGYVFDGAREMVLKQWTVARKGKKFAARLIKILARHTWLAWIGGKILKMGPRSLIREIENDLASLNPLNRIIAADTIMTLEEDKASRCRAWIQHPDPILRREVGIRCVANLCRGDISVIDDIVKCLRDEDRLVQADTLSNLPKDNLPAALVRAVEESLKSPARTWLCIWCGATNGNTGKCGKCSVSGPYVYR